MPRLLGFVVDDDGRRITDLEIPFTMGEEEPQIVNIEKRDPSDYLWTFQVSVRGHNSRPPRRPIADRPQA